jgi:hypothetical protein
MRYPGPAVVNEDGRIRGRVSRLAVRGACRTKARFVAAELDHLAGAEGSEGATSWYLSGG